MGGFAVSWNCRTGIVLFSQIKVTQSEEISTTTTSPQDEIKFVGKVDWVFKLSMPSASILLGMYKNRVENNRIFFEIPALLSCEQGNSALN